MTILLALTVLTGQAKEKQIVWEQPTTEYGTSYGDGFFNLALDVTKVELKDNETVVYITAQQRSDYPDFWFQFAGDTYLKVGEQRFTIVSADGVELNKFVQTNKNNLRNMVFHFPPLPKGTTSFDFIEGDVRGAFMLLGIHDQKYKVTAPTLQELSDANPYTVPADWFKTDTITIRGRFEGYDAEKFGFTSMECFYEDVFEKDAATLVFDIAADGSFEKKFQASYPVCNKFFSRETKIGFDEISFFARPGETIDITIKPNEQGQYACYYNNGSSKAVERWLKSSLDMNDWAYPLHMFKGKFSEVGEVTERTWQNMLYRLQVESRRGHFTPQEMQLALADLQVNFAYAVMDYPMYHGNDVRCLLSGGFGQCGVARGAPDGELSGIASCGFR